MKIDSATATNTATILEMKIDSATAANTATILGVNPAWSLVAVIFIISIALIILYAMKTGVADKVLKVHLDLKKNSESTEETAKLVAAIRADQIKSNAERHEHGDRLSRVEKAVQELQAAYCGARDCPHREVKDGD